MSKMVVELRIHEDGTQEIKWFIPAELVPIIYHNTKDDTYKYVDPIRLVFKVGLDENAESGTYYTNSRENPANAEFHPAVGNPYYYDNVTFTPFSYMSNINRVRYYAEVFMPVNGTKILNSTIFVIPATTVYYEDNFGGSEANGGLYIKYSGDWYTVNEEGTEVEGVTAKARILKDEGDYAFTVKAVDGEGEAVTMPVTVTPAKVTSLSVESVSAKTEYAYGEEIDASGISLKAVYSNGEEKVVTEGITLDKTVADENGEMTVTAEFEGTKTEFTVKVTPVLKGIRVAKAPTKTSYKFGTVIDASGLEIIAEYNDGTEKVVSGYTLKDTKADTEGTMKVGVEYEGFETEFSVNVKKTFFQKLVDFFKNIITSITGIFGKKA